MKINRLKQCKGIKLDGTRCNKTFTGKEEYCAYHHPLFAGKFRKTQKKYIIKKKYHYTRIFIYAETYNKIMQWGRDGIQNNTPNHKQNFAYYIDKYLEKEGE
jgi:hypothetical protein